MKRSLASSLVPALTLVAGVALAQPAPAPTPPPTYGPAMMGGYGPGMMGGPGARGGYGPWQGMGPGMGAGMMGGCGDGPGMGTGMFGGGMMGLGMGRALWALGLSDAQRKEAAKIGDELRKKHWAIAGQMHDEMAKIRDAGWGAGKVDRAAILAAHKRMAELGQQRLEGALDAHDRIEKILTPEQRERLGQMGPWWWMGAAQ